MIAVHAFPCTLCEPLRTLTVGEEALYYKYSLLFGLFGGVIFLMFLNINNNNIIINNMNIIFFSFFFKFYYYSSSDYYYYHYYYYCCYYHYYYITIIIIIIIIIMMYNIHDCSSCSTLHAL